MDVIELLRNDVSLAKKKRDEYVPKWQRNINERRGTDYDTAADEGRSMVPMDWTVTKTKAAQLFSQMPQVRQTAKHAKFADSVPVFTKIVNDLMTQANVEAVVSEVVVDVINAAGVGACIVSYEALTEDVEVPAIDMASLPPEVHAAAMQGTFEIPQTKGARITDRRFSANRISPGDLLWPDIFKRSDWDKAPWLGHTVRSPWAEAKRVLNLDDAVKDDVIGAAAETGGNETLNQNGNNRKSGDDTVEYDEVFYRRHLYHEDEKYYDAIQHVVFVRGLDEPVINEPWKGQEFDEENGGYIGSCLLPIRVLTLNYISDQAIPPSDSSIIRPQVVELQQSRQDRKDQRKHSKPLRWVNIDLIDPSMTPAILDGTWQGLVPTIGPGDRAIGEVSRSAYPRENDEFDAQLKRDIQEAVSVGPNQSGQYATGERSAQEAAIVQSSFQTENGQMRAKVAAFIVGIAQVLSGLFCLYGEIEENGIGASIGEDGMKRLATWDRTRINQKFIMDVRSDSTVRLDAQQLLQQLTSVLNVTAQSGFINPKPLIQRIIELNGIDPAEVMVDPQPKGPEPSKISYSFKGEDLVDPFVIALLVHNKQAPSPEELKAALAIQEAVKKSADPSNVGSDPLPNAPGGPPPPAGPTQNPEVPEKAYPDHEAAPRVITRRAEG